MIALLYGVKISTVRCFSFVTEHACDGRTELRLARLHVICVVTIVQSSGSILCITLYSMLIDNASPCTHCDVWCCKLLCTDLEVAGAVAVEAEFDGDIQQNVELSMTDQPTQDSDVDRYLTCALVTCVLL